MLTSKMFFSFNNHGENRVLKALKTWPVAAKKSGQWCERARMTLEDAVRAVVNMQRDVLK